MQPKLAADGIPLALQAHLSCALAAILLFPFILIAERMTGGARVTVAKDRRELLSGYTVELVQVLGSEDVPALLKLSQSIIDYFGLNLVVSRGDLKRYFDYPETFPFVVRRQGVPIGFLIAAPLERYEAEPWAACDINLREGNTLYTLAFAVLPAYRKRGIARRLKEDYHRWARARGYLYVTGNVASGVSGRFDGEAEVVKVFENWNDTGRTFE